MLLIGEDRSTLRQVLANAQVLIEAGPTVLPEFQMPPALNHCSHHREYESNSLPVSVLALRTAHKSQQTWLQLHR